MVHERAVCVSGAALGGEGEPTRVEGIDQGGAAENSGGHGTPEPLVLTDTGEHYRATELNFWGRGSASNGRTCQYVKAKGSTNSPPDGRSRFAEFLGCGVLLGELNDGLQTWKFG